MPMYLKESSVLSPLCFRSEKSMITLLVWTLSVFLIGAATSQMGIAPMIISAIACTGVTLWVSYAVANE